MTIANSITNANGIKIKNHMMYKRTPMMMMVMMTMIIIKVYFVSLYIDITVYDTGTKLVLLI